MKRMELGSGFASSPKNLKLPTEEIYQNSGDLDIIRSN